MIGPEHLKKAKYLLEAYKEALADVDSMPVNNVEQRDSKFSAQGNARALLSAAEVHANIAGLCLRINKEVDQDTPWFGAWGEAAEA